MAGHDACFAPVLSKDAAPHDTQMQAREVFTVFDGVLQPSPAPRFSRTPGSLRRRAPFSDEHVDEILRVAGIIGAP